MRIEKFEKDRVENVRYIELVDRRGVIDVVVVDENGDLVPGGRICIISQGGILVCKHLLSSLGFKTDEKNRIEVCFER